MQRNVHSTWHRSCPNTSPGEGTSQRSSLTLSFDVSFLWEACPIPFPPQGERRAVWPSLGKFLRRPSPVPSCEKEAHPLLGQPRGSFPTLCVNKGRFWRPFCPCICSVLSTRLGTVWKQPQPTGICSGCPHPGQGTHMNNNGVSGQVHVS